MGHHEHGCDCGCENEEENIFTLEFDDDENVECVALGIFEVDGKDYVALVPTDEESDDIFLFEYREAGEEFELIDIEDDDLFDKVAAEFESICEEMEAAEEE